MYSVKSILANKSGKLVLSLIVIFSINASAQENSPYSRYGLGDLVPNGHIANRTMGGVSAAYTDFQSINFANPASFGSIGSTIYDVGAEVDSRALQSNISPDKFRSNNLSISYVQLGVPLTTKKMIKKGKSWGFTFGLHPLTRINYKISSNTRLTGIDSLQTVYEGSGGLNQVSIGTGYRYKKLRIGVSAAYNFGIKNYSTKLSLINDSVVYYKSLTEANSHFGGWSLTAGIMYEIPIRKSTLRLGAYGSVFSDLNSKRNELSETFIFDGSGGIIPVDTVSLLSNIKGKLTMPQQHAVGLCWSNTHLTIGADIEFTKWGQYSYYGQKDSVQDIWRFRAGIQYYPASENTAADKYFQFVKYRLGFYYGPDYVKLNQSRNEYAVTFGAGFPLTNFQLLRRGEFVILNTGIEAGSRGEKNIGDIRENFIRFNFGISMNARWFQKPKYD